MTPRPPLTLISIGFCLSAAACATVPEPPAITEQSFRVMSWNVNFGLAGDAGAVEVINNADVDIVLIQETDATWHRLFKQELKKAFPYQRHHADRSPAGGLTVLSKYPILEDTLLPNEVSWFPGQRTVFKTPAGEVQTLNVHLRPPFSDSGSVITGYFTTKSVRGAEMESFLERLYPEIPTIVAGDFNEASGQATALLEEDGFVSALATWDPDSNTWHWPVPILGAVTGTLDHVYVDARLATVDAWVLQEGRSDHYPVVAWIQAPSRAAAAQGIPRRGTIPSVTSGYSIQSSR